MVSEFKGLSTPTTLSKPDSPIYSWHFVTSATPLAAVDNRILPPPQHLETILNELHLDIKSKGIDAFWNLRTRMINLDKQTHSSGKIEREDLKDALTIWGVTLPRAYFDRVIDVVDITKTGLIDWSEFLNLVRGEMSSRRGGVVAEVFSSLLTAAGAGKTALTPDDLAFYMNAKEHPLVSVGGAAEQEALAHMLNHISVKGRTPATVRFEGFLQYYADLSAGVDDEEFFEQIVRGGWA